MKIISSQEFIMMERIIECNQQLNIEKVKHIHLYENYIQTTNKEFIIEDVLDISFKSSSTDYGILYLHTTQGLFPFHVKTDPTHFIQQFVRLKQNDI